jgi:geranylgeranyl pyrophosphate synthase
MRLQIQPELREKQEFIRNALKSISLEAFHPFLKDPVKHMPPTDGKLLRPLICALSTEAVGGDYRKAKDAFLALELIHNGALFHDDVLDEDPLRRGKPSAYAKFGAKRAILAGDLLFALGLRHAAKLKNPEIITLLAETTERMLEGAALQTSFRRTMISKTQYIKIARKKSGALFRASAILGSLVGGGAREEKRRLGEFGENFGIAYQIRDDILGIFSNGEIGKLPGIDILNGDSTLPLIYALNLGKIKDEERVYLLDRFEGREKLLEIEKIREIYVKSGALKKSIQTMKLFSDKSKKSILKLRESDAKRELSSLVDNLFLNFKTA